MLPDRIMLLPIQALGVLADIVIVRSEGAETEIVAEALQPKGVMPTTE